MSKHERGQLVSSAAEVYEEFFVPALFAQWAERLIERAGVAPGQTVLDVACGTGVLARAVSERVGPAGRVVGLDINEGMLAVARRTSPKVEWVRANAQSLPFEAQAFDHVLGQFGLMFFEDRLGALQEMWRVLRPGGRLVVATWARLQHAPGYAAMAALLDELFGSEVAASLRAPYCLGDERELAELLSAAGVTAARVEQVAGVARFASIADWVRTDIRGWTLADALDEAQFATLSDAAQRKLARFVTESGRVEFAHPAMVVSATKG